MYFLKSISNEVKSAQIIFHHHSKAKRLVLGALFSSIAAILQAVGGVLPGVGFLISPLATAPILYCSLFSIPLGFISYLLTNLLLLILQPSELFVFSFTTGLLGLGTGIAFSIFKKRLSIIASGAALLTLGITCLLFIFHFPVLGPAPIDSFSFLTTSGIFLFAFIYNWIWVEATLFFIKIK